MGITQSHPYDSATMGITQSHALSEQQLFILPDHLLIEACKKLDIRMLANIAGVNGRLRSTIKNVIVSRAHGSLSKILPYDHIPSFMAMLSKTQSVVGGSIAQAVITPSIFERHPPSNLNVFVPWGALIDWEIYLANIGCTYSSEWRVNDANSRRSMTFNLHGLDGSTKAIIVCEAKGSSCLTPVLAAKYTCNINFFTPDHVYCIFPHFTPQLKTLQVIRRTPPTDEETAEKNLLLERGVTFITAKEEKALCKDNIICRSMIRVTGTKPLRLTSHWAGDKIGILAWGDGKEEFLHSKRVQFWLGGACDSVNCINDPYLSRGDEWGGVIADSTV